MFLIKGNNLLTKDKILERFKNYYPSLKANFISDLTKEEYKQLLGKKKLYIIN